MAFCDRAEVPEKGLKTLIKKGFLSFMMNTDHTLISNQYVSIDYLCAHISPSPQGLNYESYFNQRHSQGRNQSWHCQEQKTHRT